MTLVLIRFLLNTLFFVLAFCVIEKKHYYEYVVPRVEKLKFDTFGTDIPILHEREIRQQRRV